MNDSYIESWNPMHLHFWTLCSSKFLHRITRTAANAPPIREIIDSDEAMVGELIVDEERGQWPLVGSTREHTPALIVVSEA
jgi:hypothetical protein